MGFMGRRGKGISQKEKQVFDVDDFVIVDGNTEQPYQIIEILTKTSYKIRKISTGNVYKCSNKRLTDTP